MFSDTFRRCQQTYYMNINTTTPLLDSIERFGNRMKSMEEKDLPFTSKIELFKDELIPIMNYLECNEAQAIIFSAVFFLCITEGSCHINDVAVFLKTSPFEMIRLESDFQALLKKKYIMQSDKNNRRRREHYFIIPNNLVDMVSKNQQPAPLNENMSLYDLADVFSISYEEVRESMITIEQLSNEINFYQERFPALGIFKLMNQLDLSDDEKILLIYIFINNCKGTDYVDIYWVLDGANESGQGGWY